MKKLSKKILINRCSIEKLPTARFKKIKKSQLLISVALITLLIKGPAIAQVPQIIGVIAIGVGAGAAYMEAKKNKNKPPKGSNQDKAADKIPSTDSSSTNKQISSTPQEPNLNSSKKEKPISANTGAFNKSDKQTSEVTANSISNKKDAKSSTGAATKPVNTNVVKENQKPIEKTSYTQAEESYYIPSIRKDGKLPAHWGNPNLLIEVWQGKILLKADIGYAYNFGGSWKDVDGDFNNNGNSGVGFGAALGWTHFLGFGLSANYLNLPSNWQDQFGNIYNGRNHLISLTPSYRFSFGSDNAWGLRLGLGIGLNIIDATTSTNNQTAQGFQIINAARSKSDAVASTTDIGNSNAIKISSAAAYSVNGTTTSYNSIKHDNGSVYRSLYGEAKFMLDSKGVNANTVFTSVVGSVTIATNSLYHCLDEGGGTFGESDCRYYTNNSKAEWDNRSYDQIIADRLKKNAIQLIGTTGQISKGVITALLNDGSTEAVAVYNNWLSNLSGNWYETLGERDVLWLSSSALNNITGATATAKLANIQILLGQGTIFTGQVSKNGAAGIGWRAWASDASKAVEFKNLLSQATSINMEKIGSRDVLFVADAVWQGLSGASEEDKKLQINSLREFGSYIYYGMVNKNDSNGNIGWKTWAKDSTKAVEFKNLLDAAPVANIQKLSKDEVVWVANNVWQGLDAFGGIGIDDEAKKKSKIEALRGDGSYIYYGQVTKEGALGWKTLLLNPQRTMVFNNLFQAATAINMEKMSDKEVLFISNNTLNRLQGDNIDSKKTIIESLKAVNVGEASYVFYGQVAKEGGAGQGWKTWLLDANKSTEFNNLYAAATVANMQKLANKEVLFISDQILAGVVGDNDISRKAKINALKGAGSYVFYGQVPKDGDIGIGWKIWATTVRYVTEFKNLITSATAVHMEKLTSGEEITIPYIIWNAMDGITADEKQEKISSLAGSGKIAFAAAPQTEANPPKPIGMILLPEVALEYDNGFWHVDLNFRYIHQLTDIRHKTADNDYQQLAGPLGIFVGTSFGVNF